MKRKMRDAGFAEDPAGAIDAGLITEDESARLAAADKAVLAAIAVDSFTREEILEFAPVRRRRERSRSTALHSA